MEEIVSIKIQAGWLLIVPFLFMFSLFIIALIMKSSSGGKEELKGEGKDNKKIEKERTLTSWVKKKDILYWLLIICLGAISLFTYQYRGSDEVINHWSFAGTIVSIILAVVAIGFTLFQTLSSDLSSAKIAESAEKIVVASTELDSSELQKSSDIIKDAASGLLQMQSIIESKFNTLNAELYEIKKGHQESLSVLSNLNTDSKLKSNENSDINLSMDEFIRNVFPKLADYTQGVAYLFFRSLYRSYTTDNEYVYLKEFGNSSLTDLSEDIRPTVVMGAYLGISQFLRLNGTGNDFDELSNKEETLKKLEALFETEELRKIILEIISNIEK